MNNEAKNPPETYPMLPAQVNPPYPQPSAQYGFVPQMNNPYPQDCYPSQALPPGPGPQIIAGGVPGGQLYNIQPGAQMTQVGMWVPCPQPIEGVTPGLEYLTMVDTIVVNQLMETIELLTGFETENKYSLRNALGQQVYFAAEVSSCMSRFFLGNKRPFTIHVVDNFQREVIMVKRPYKFCGSSCCACCGCCAQECTVESPRGTVIGTITQRCTFCSIGFYIKDEHDNEVFQIEGPTCGGCCPTKKFEVKSLTGVDVGCITKKWSGFEKEMFSDADVFKVTFPMDLDVRMKALLIGATFLIDFMAFEDSSNKSR